VSIALRPATTLGAISDKVRAFQLYEYDCAVWHITQPSHFPFSFTENSIYILTVVLLWRGASRLFPLATPRRVELGVAMGMASTTHDHIGANGVS